jgi:hypothetical protein
MPAKIEAPQSEVRKAFAGLDDYALADARRAKEAEIASHKKNVSGRFRRVAIENVERGQHQAMLELQSFVDVSIAAMLKGGDKGAWRLPPGFAEVYLFATDPAVKDFVLERLAKHPSGPTGRFTEVDEASWRAKLEALEAESEAMRVELYARPQRGVAWVENERLRRMEAGTTA